MSSRSPTVAVILVNWNGWQQSLAAHASLQAGVGADWHCFIVDNNSSDGSADRLAGLGDTVTLIRNTTNQGFAGGCNVAIRAALAAGHDYVFLLNNDATVEPDTLARLMAAVTEHPDAVLGCVVQYVDSGMIQFFGSATDPSSGDPSWYDPVKQVDLLDREHIDSDFIFGAALFAPARLFEKVGLFDERFFLTFEETDWCYRVRKAAGRCMIVRNAIVHHEGSATLGSVTSPLQAYFLQRNRLLFLEKHGSFRHRLRGAKSSLSAVRYASSAATRKALMIAIGDYVMRRFGDSPSVVRMIGVTRPRPAS